MTPALQSPLADQPEAPSPIDIHLGRRLKLRRTAAGVTQEQLAAQIGVTFQQIQKYESGVNRMSTSRLWQISQALRCPVSFFYMGLSGEREQPMISMENGVDSIRLARAYSLIKDPAIRARLLALATGLAKSTNS